MAFFLYYLNLRMQWKVHAGEDTYTEDIQTYREAWLRCGCASCCYARTNLIFVLTKKKIRV